MQPSTVQVFDSFYDSLATMVQAQIASILCIQSTIEVQVMNVQKQVGS
jgi:hypothetical protein